jgi:hypothetical protein
MEKTWASGAVELLRHADSHINLESAFDRRIAFISIDNAIETMIRTFLALPKSKSGISVSRKQVEEAEKSFPLLLEMFWSNVGARLTGIDESDIEHYHRIRNTLYHNGTGLSVDVEYLLAYRQIAALILRSLFGVNPSPPKPAPTLEHLIVLWNRLEEQFKTKLGKSGFNQRYTYYWKEAMSKGLVNQDDVQRLTELRTIRNRQVHSSKIDSKEVEYAIGLAEMLLQKIGRPS